MTIIPLWITWLLFDFIFRQLSKFGIPVVRTLSRNISDEAPIVAKLLLQPRFQELLAVVIVLAALYALGWAANRVIGKQIVNAVDSVVGRLPVVKRVYGAIKRLIGALQTKPDNVQRVVLIEFPNAHMKTIGLVTRTLVDSDTGQALAAVYVPTTPNPTSGYLEIVPLDRVVSTDLTIDEAMNVIISGGATAPEHIPFSAKQK